MSELYKELEEKPYIDAFHYIEWLGEKTEDKKLIKINRFLQEDRKAKDKEIERLKEENNYYFKKNNELSTLNTSLRSDRDKYKNIIKEVREYIEENQEEHKYTDRGGFTYTEGHFLRDSDTLLEILDKENK